MDNFSSYLIVNTSFLQHETKKFYRIYTAFEKLMFKEQENLKCFWTTKHTDNGMRIKFYFIESNQVQVLVKSDLFKRLINIIERNFSFKPKIIFQDPSSNLRAI